MVRSSMPFNLDRNNISIEQLIGSINSSSAILNLNQEELKYNICIYYNYTINECLNINDRTNAEDDIDSAGNNMSADFINSYFKFRCILSWISLCVILIGLLGNFISFIILINPKMRISTNVFLASLCVSGFIALLGLLANSVLHDLFSYYQIKKGQLYISFMYPYVYPLIVTFQMSSILLIVCVSLNQFIYIYFSGAKRRTQKNRNKDCLNALKVNTNETCK
jgi:hypothetical protein